MVGLPGVTTIDSTEVGVTVTPVAPVVVPDTAVTLHVPAATVVSKPFEPETSLMAATLGADEDHFEVAVMFWVVPLL
jgi:hypothetical protein